MDFYSQILLMRRIIIKAGDVIASQGTLGTVGKTGDGIGPHLHL
jgi:murein DD-endopeptidase MepM/ murein hydrolase activator NlpD